MKTFASDWSEEDEAARMKCLPDNDALFQRPLPHLSIPFPAAARRRAAGIEVRSAGRLWLSPASLAEAAGLMREHAAAGVRPVAGNTEYGIYPQAYLQAGVLVDLRFVPELHAAPAYDEAQARVRIPAGTTYSALIAFLEGVLRERGETETGPDGTPVPKETTSLGALYHMARRTAGRIVRNAATVGGNTMLVLQHIAGGSGAPFPSDAATAMVATGAVVDYLDSGDGAAARLRSLPLEALAAQVLAEPGLVRRLLLVAYVLPCGDGELACPHKVALREVNAHSIVNATSWLRFDAQGRVDDARLVFGAIAPYPWRAANTEAALRGQVLSPAGLGALALVLRDEVREELGRWQARAAEQAAEGFSDDYRIQLCLSFLYKSLLQALEGRGAALPPQLRSGGAMTFGRWAVSTGSQRYKSQAWKRPVGQPFIKHLALEQASGQIHYTHELSVPPGTVNAAFVQSARALAAWCFALPADDGAAQAATVNALRAHLSARFPAFVDLVTSDDFAPGQANLQGMGADQPIFAQGDVQYVGQSLALVCAASQEQALAIADYVAGACVAYGPVTPPSMPDTPAGTAAPDWWSAPVLGLEQAIGLGSIYPDYPLNAPFNSHIWKITRPGSRFGWADLARAPLDKRITDVAATVDGAPCRVVGNTQATGGQLHFYMEPQAAIAEPVDARRMIVRPSSQSPQEMHGTVALALASQYNRIEVQVAPVGGGFGGKTEQARFVTGAAAVAAHALKRPVRLALAREQDSAMIGKRHAYYGQCQVAIDDGSREPADKGILRGMLNRMWGDGGAFYDCSFIVANCIQTRADNAYMVRHFENQIDVCRTNTAPSTAFRAFGDIQGKLITENAIDDAAFAIGMRAEEVRRKNMYQPGDATPFGQALDDCYIAEVWDYLAGEADYEGKLAQADAFNRANRWRKRGVAMVPVKYGSGYNLAMLEQASASIAIYQGDGSIVIHQGGVEMGQGLLTQVRQIAAYVLNVPMDIIEVAAANTAVVPNPSSTGGSTGTAYNGEAVKRLCQQMRSRLAAFADAMRTENGDDWCRENGIDYWNHGDKGWRARIELRGRQVMVWQNLVALAYQNRVGLVASFTAPIAGGETPCAALTYKPLALQPVIPGYRADPSGQPGGFDQFVGFTYSAACAVVEVDVLTGEVKVLSADIAYDMGWSLNPAVDIGQVEGAFVQGIGYVLSEQLVFEPKAAPGALRNTPEGTLNTLNTWTYKPPAVTSIPLELNTHLFPRDRVKTPPSPTDGVLSSKEVGEPPLVLACSVFFAVKAAVRASRLERGLDGLFRLDVPGHGTGSTARVRTRSTSLFGANMTHRPEQALAPSFLAAILGAAAVAACAAALAAEPASRPPAAKAQLTRLAAGAPDNRSANSVFPDFGYMVDPTVYQNQYADQPIFRLKTDFPTVKPTALPDFMKIDFHKDPQAYILGVRDYAFDGNLPDWNPFANRKRGWYHIPWLHPSSPAGGYPPNGGTEGFRGLIKEADIAPFQLGAGQKGKDGGYSVYAITLVNAQAGYTLGKMWADPANPDPRATDRRYGGGFPEGTVFAKLLFTDAPQGDDTLPFMKNPLTWKAYITQNFWKSAERQVTNVNLLQMDIAVRDSRARETGWVMGTFVYNGEVNNPNKFLNLVPVGLMWGNDPGITANATTPFPPLETRVNPALKETVIFSSKQLPPQHLGWNGRLNGPADLNTTSCLSCHNAAQYPALTALVPAGATPPGGPTPPKEGGSRDWMKWFQNLPAATSSDLRAYSTDFSFQVAISLTNFYAAKGAWLEGRWASEYGAPTVNIGRGGPLEPKTGSQERK